MKQIFTGLFQSKIAKIYSGIIVIIGLLFNYCVYQSNSFGCVPYYAALLALTFPGVIILKLLYLLIDILLIFQLHDVDEWMRANSDARAYDVLLATLLWACSALLTIIIVHIIFNRKALKKVSATHATVDNKDMKP